MFISRSLEALKHRIRRVLPASVVHARRDVRWTDIHEGRHGEGGIARRINIARSHCFPKKTICFLPQRPLPGETAYEGSRARRGAVVYKLCRLLGYGIAGADSVPTGNALRRYDAVFKYDRSTFLDPLPVGLSAEEDVINGGCTDISKRAVNAAFEEVFGYALGVDPTTYDREMVVKSNLNAAHDGTVVQGPLAEANVAERRAYQKVVDNTVDDRAYVLDYRVPVYGRRIPLVYRKYRPLKSRFIGSSVHTTLAAPTEVFSEEELEKIPRLARHMGVDFGELDVLRDRGDGRIYVVDVNPTPWGPPRGLTEAGRKRALARLEPAFEAFIQQYALR